MKVKTIKKIITKKLNDYLNSITDKDLRQDVKKSIVLSGGAITSMLLKEDVNDYDIYIKDMDVLIRLVKYYGLSHFDGRRKAYYMSQHKPTVWLDGSEVPNDTLECVRVRTLSADQVKIDIDSAGKRYELKLSSEKTPLKYQIAFVSQNAISFTDDIQIVTRFTGDVERIHKTFDFIHATNYFTFEAGLVLNNAALTSIITKELVYQGSLYPLTSIIRMKKFVLRGWTINAGQILKMVAQCGDFDLTDVDTLEDQLIGVDVAYFADLINSIRSGDEFPPRERFMDMIDEVFESFSME